MAICLFSPKKMRGRERRRIKCCLLVFCSSPFCFLLSSCSSFPLSGSQSGELEIGGGGGGQSAPPFTLPKKSLLHPKRSERETELISEERVFRRKQGSHCPIHSSHHGRRLERILHLRLFLRGIEDDVRGRLHFIASRLRLALFIRPPIYGIANAAKIFVRPLPALWRACLFYMPSVQTNLPTHHSSPNWRRRHIANTFLRVICSRLFHLLFFLLLSFSYNTHTREEEEEARPRREGGRKKRTNIIVFERGKGKKCRNYTGKGREGGGKLGRGNR